MTAKENFCVATPEFVDFRKDGLLYCGHCQTPKECRIKFDFGERVVRCVCACEERRRLAEEKAVANQQKALRIRNLRASGIHDKNLRECRFDTATETPELRKCRSYAENWKKMSEENSGLLFWGNTGTGKTFSAACIGNHLIDRGTPVMMTSFPRILNAGGFDKTELIKQLQYYPLLILDDLGTERANSYALELLYLVIDERYKSRKPLIVTTNLTLDQMCKPSCMEYQRIFDRVLEMCVPLVFKGKNHRRDIANEKLNRARDLLAGGTHEDSY